MARLSLGLVAEEIKKQDGNLAAVGRAFKVTRQAVFTFVNNHPALKEVVSEARETMLDEAENALHKAIRNGQGWAVCFFLKTQGKSRGYVERPSADDVSSQTGALIVNGVDPDVVTGKKAEPATDANLYAVAEPAAT